MSETRNLPTRALSIRQPWAHYIIHLPDSCRKDIENRDWDKPGCAPRLVFRGWLWVHASVKPTAPKWREEFVDASEVAIHTVGVHPNDACPPSERIQFGAIIGVVEVLNVVTEHPSKWFVGPQGLVLGRRKELPEAVPCRGALGFWRVPDDVMMRLQAVTARAT